MIKRVGNASVAVFTAFVLRVAPFWKSDRSAHFLPFTRAYSRNGEVRWVDRLRELLEVVRKCETGAYTHS